MTDTSFGTIDMCSLEDVTGGARKKTTRKKTPAVDYDARPFPGGGSQAIDGLGQMRLSDFCRREPFACANMRAGGNI
jgi:hypothetical protein